MNLPGATTEVATLKQALSEAEDKAAKERTERERQEARVGEVQQELQALVTKHEALELDSKTRESELVAALKRDGYWIAVETNGTNDADWLAFVDYVACSPKAEFPESLRLKSADEVRVVASSESVVRFCESLPDRIKATDYYVSPCEREGDIDFAAAKSVLSKLDGWSLSVQLHKLLGFR